MSDTKTKSAAEIMLQNQVNIRRLDMDFPKKFADMFHQITELISRKTEQLEKVQQFVSITKDKTKKAKFKGQIQAYEIEIRTLENILVNLQTLTDFHFKTSGSQQIINELEHTKKMLKNTQQYAESVNAYNNQLFILLKKVYERQSKTTSK
jgi:hypothetical protein